MAGRAWKSVGVVAVAVGALLGSVGVAQAAVQQALGHLVTPAQPYLNNPNISDWLGSYLVDGTPRFPVEFAFLPPDTDEQYQPGGALTTKWGTTLTADQLAGINSMLFRNADSTSSDVHAAIAHIIFGLTSAPQTPIQLDPTNDSRHIAYDSPFHVSRLPSSVQALVTSLTDEMTLYAGPWDLNLTAPAAPNVLGRAATWSLDVTGASSAVVPGVAVTVTVNGGTIDGGGSGPVSFVTPLDGSPLTFEVTPTSANFEVLVSADAPAAEPTTLQPVDLQVARLVLPVSALISDGVAAVAEPAGIVVTPTSGSLTLGGSQSYTVQTVDDDGLVVADVSATATLTIAPDGSCTGSTCTPAAAGPHLVTANFGQFMATATLDVAAVATTTTLAETTTTTAEPTTTSTTSTTVAPLPPTPSSTSTVPVVLPETGGNGSRDAGIALVTLLAGCSLLVLGRRRRTAG